jgi:hypothetical protein
VHYNVKLFYDNIKYYTFYNSYVRCDIEHSYMHTTMINVDSQISLFKWFNKPVFMDTSEIRQLMGLLLNAENWQSKYMFYHSDHVIFAKTRVG